MDTETAYEDQIPPELLARVEAERDEENRKHELAPDEAPADELAPLMRQPPGERNFGTARWGGSPPGSDPEDRRWGDSAPKRPDRYPRQLDYEEWAKINYLTGQEGHHWHIEYVKTGRPNGRPPGALGEDPRTRAYIYERVCPLDEFKRLTRWGGKKRTPEETAARLALGRNVAAFIARTRGKGAEAALVSAYGCASSTIYALAKLGGTEQSEGNP